MLLGFRVEEVIFRESRDIQVMLRRWAYLSDVSFSHYKSATLTILNNSMAYSLRRQVRYPMERPRHFSVRQQTDPALQVTHPSSTTPKPYNSSD